MSHGEGSTGDSFGFPVMEGRGVNREQLWFPSLAEMPFTSQGLTLVLELNGMKISKNRSWEALKQEKGYLQKWYYTPFQLVLGTY